MYFTQRQQYLSKSAQFAQISVKLRIPRITKYERYRVSLGLPVTAKDKKVAKIFIIDLVDKNKTIVPII